MSGNVGLHRGAWIALGRRDILRSAGLAAGAAAFGSWLPRSARAQETFVWYTGLATEASDAVSKRFTEQTGIPVEYFRAGSNNVVQKFDQERQADQVRCSAILIAIPVLAAQWAKEGVLERYDSPEFAHYPAEFVVEGYSAPTSGEAMSMAYNTEMISAEEAPKTWEDLLDPKWKGKLALTDAASASSALHWFAAIQSVYGKEFMEKLSQQDVLVRTGGADVANTLVSGERPVAAAITQSHASRAIGKGGALRIVVPEAGAPLISTVVCIPAQGPDTETGKQFVDFILSEEVQVMLQDEYFSPSLREGMPPFKLDTGARPLSEVKPMASSQADLERFMGERAELMQEYMNLFK
jgi:iron(III) transport system substrate-binding protein